MVRGRKRYTTKSWRSPSEVDFTLGRGPSDKVPPSDRGESRNFPKCVFNHFRSSEGNFVRGVLKTRNMSIRPSDDRKTKNNTGGTGGFLGRAFPENPSRAVLHPMCCPSRAYHSGGFDTPYHFLHYCFDARTQLIDGVGML